MEFAGDGFHRSRSAADQLANALGRQSGPRHESTLSLRQSDRVRELQTAVAQLLPQVSHQRQSFEIVSPSLGGDRALGTEVQQLQIRVPRNHHDLLRVVRQQPAQQRVAP